MIQQRFEGCIIGGAIGDAWGSGYENQVIQNNSSVYYWNQPAKQENKWVITDDTQLTLASCEALCEQQEFSPELLCKYFIRYHKEKKLNGPGSATLKALIDLEAGIHWNQAGRTGEYAAGNGAAMRIAPFAFSPDITREDIRDICRITHRNDEAYTGALAVFLSLRAIINNEWDGNNNLFNVLIPHLPDTRVRDRLIEINQAGENATITEIAKLGTNGYVVNSIPFAIFASTQIIKTGFTGMIETVIACGGDTDTNASVAGQVSGALIGINNIPLNLKLKLQELKEYDEMKSVIQNTNTRFYH